MGASKTARIPFCEETKQDQIIPEEELTTVSPPRVSLRKECRNICPKAEEIALAQHHGGLRMKKCFSKCRSVSKVGSYKGHWRFHVIPCSKCKKPPSNSNEMRVKKAVEIANKLAAKVIKAKKIAVEKKH